MKNGEVCLRNLVTIFVDNTDLLSVRIPLHPTNHRLITVVYHFLVPRPCHINIKYYIILFTL